MVHFRLPVFDFRLFLMMSVYFVFAGSCLLLFVNVCSHSLIVLDSGERSFRLNTSRRCGSESVSNTEVNEVKQRPV